MPHLNGQLDNYLLASMRKMQKGRLPTEVQNHVPAALSESELAAIAQYYQGVKATRPVQVTDPEKVARGEPLAYVEEMDGRNMAIAAIPTRGDGGKVTGAVVDVVDAPSTATLRCVLSHASSCALLVSRGRPSSARRARRSSGSTGTGTGSSRAAR